MTDSELDRQVAEKIMQLELVDLEGEVRWVRRDRLIDFSTNYEDPVPKRWCVPHGRIYAETHKIPSYSTNPAAMLLLIERMRERGLIVSMGTAVEREWSVTFSRKVPYQANTYETAGEAIDDSLCRAVCLAALRAVEPPSEPRR